MRIGFDFDGTITKNPVLFKLIIDSLIFSGNEIFIISGTAEKDRHIVDNELMSYNIQLDDTHIILKPDYSNINGTNIWKFDVIDRLKIRAYFDNRVETTDYVNSLCTTFLVK